VEQTSTVTPNNFPAPPPKLPNGAAAPRLGAILTVTVTVYIAVVASAAITVYATGAVKSLGVTVLVCSTAGAPTSTLIPVVVNVATRVVTSIPFNTVTAMVFASSFIVPAAPLSENAVMALEVARALVTVTVYIAVVASAAVTVYATGAVKLLGVTVLVCSKPPTFTLAPVVVNVATRAVTSVPNGTVTAMVFAGSFMIPVAPG
jgi:cell division protein FtsL